MEIYQIRFFKAVAISILLHTIIAIFMPNFLNIYTIPISKEKIIEVQRLIKETKIEEPIKEKPEPKVEEKKEMAQTKEEEYFQIPTSVEEAINGKIKEIRLGEKFTPPPPITSIPLPAQEKAPDAVNSPATFKKYTPPDSIKKFEPDGSIIIGSALGKRNDIPLPNIKAEAKFNIQEAQVVDGFKASAEAVQGTEPGLKIKELNLKLGLEGEIVDRNIDNRPSAPPSVKIDVPTTVFLDFEVLPDGTIIKIRPQKRVDVNLERIAIDYLKKWKFSPLPTNAIQKNQKGTLKIKFEIG